jgi:hypothetical protein
VHHGVSYRLLWPKIGKDTVGAFEAQP